MADNWTFIDKSKEKELWLFELSHPSGEKAKFYRGHVFMTIDGIQKKMPDDHTFVTKEEAMLWFME